MYRLLETWFEFDQRLTWSLSPSWYWLVYNLPDGLWSYSLTSFLIITTRTDSQVTKIFYLLLGLAMMLVTEIIYGTFDWLDVIAMVGGVLASVWLLQTHLRTKVNASHI